MSQFSIYAWQQAPLQRLQVAIERQRLPHAILFSGLEGTGKQHLANCLVSSVLKKHTRLNRGEKLLDINVHPDVITINPIKDKKQILIEQTRDLSAKLSLTPQISDIKIALINPAELMTVSASNALLKTLEEPSGNTLIILISHNYGRLPQTIRSRCHHVPLMVPDMQEAEAWLSERGVNNCHEYLLLTHGSPLLALHAFQNGWLESYRQLLIDLSDLIKQHSDIVSVATRWSNIDVAQLIRWLQNLVKLVIKLKFDDKIISDTAVDLLEEMKRSFNRLDLKKLVNYADFLDKSALEADNNLNRELFIEQIFSQWTMLTT